MSRNKGFGPQNSQPRARRALLGDFVLEDVHLYRINRHTFTVYVGGDPDYPVGIDCDGSEPGVEYLMANRFEINLGILSGIDPNRPILVEMATRGGNCEEGMQMFSAILTCPNPVTVLATKWACSMASIIPLAADKFVIRPPAQYMYHGGTFAFSGLDQEADTADIERRKGAELILRLYTARLKEQGKFSLWTEAKIRAMLTNHLKERIDVWLSADEAREWGFADAVFEGNVKILRAMKKNVRRRRAMFDVLRTPITATVIVK